MKVSQHINTTVFTWDCSDPVGIDFRNLIKGHYKNLHQQNIVIDLSAIEGLKTKDVLEFSELNAYNKENVLKSFVAVVGTMSIAEIPDEISTAPTLQEALDIVDMEEIERDLGY
ncbi:MAG: ribonuclease Z [Flavobacteriaceae bacterium]|nr:ribonuclease Z [Flavobacteriaceae bacterium]|tara:strand:+ start:374 stop:715 length:342 start_codon:yes stop_codon:yes gene_type:complete